MLGRAGKSAGLAVAALGLMAGPVAADAPTHQSAPIVGAEIRCGQTVLTAVSGSFVGTFHEHEKKHGLVQEVFNSRLVKAVLTDQSGTEYRAVGSVHGTFTFDPAIDEGHGSFIANFNFIGPHGKFGDIKERFRVTREGQIVAKMFGSCQSPED